MKFEAVEGRGDLLRNYKRYNFYDSTVLIGIWSPGDFAKLQSKEPEYIKDYRKMTRHFKDAVVEEFWDTENNVDGYPTISEEQAILLIKFIDKHMDADYVIHCDAGQSRSAGVAMAVECIINFNGDTYNYAISPKYTDDERYSPNKEVFKIIMETYNKIKNEEISIYDTSKDDMKFTNKDESPLGSNPFMED